MPTVRSNHCTRFSLLLLALLQLLPNGCGLLPNMLAHADRRAAVDALDGDAFSASLKVLHYGVHVNALGTMDPHFATGSQDRAVADMVFNGLLRYRPGNAPYIEPDLALALPDLEMEAGRQVWTFKLRRGVLFHPGPLTEAYELTSADVVYSLQKAADPERSAYAGEYAGMSFAAVNRYTVRVVVDTPLSPILFLPKFTDYGGGFIVARRALEAVGDAAFAAHPVGTGPFLFHTHLPGERLSLKAHRDYFRGRPLLDGVALHFLPDDSEREAGLRIGRLDVAVGSVAAAWERRMAEEREIVVDYHGIGEAVAIHLNTRMAPLDDLRVRRAIVLALDHERFREISSPKLADLIFSPVPAPLLPGGLDRETAAQLGLLPVQDIPRARALLAEAGYADGFTLELVGSGKRIYRACYEMLQAQLAVVGIECRLRLVPHGEMHRLVRNRPQALVVYAAWRPNADGFLSRFFHSNAIVRTGVHPDTNFSHYSKIDMLIDAARGEIVPAKQVNLWVQAQIRLLSDAAVYPLISTKQCHARGADLDYGHPLIATMALYPQFTEQTHFREAR